jgi:hypothetical protein
VSILCSNVLAWNLECVSDIDGMDWMRTLGGALYVILHSFRSAMYNAHFVSPLLLACFL